MTKQESPMTLNTRVLNIDGVLNFRDLGGYRSSDGRQLAWGKVFRSAQLDRLSEQGIAELAALDVQTVVDLRFSNETQSTPLFFVPYQMQKLFLGMMNVKKEAAISLLQCNWRGRKV